MPLTFEKLEALLNWLNPNRQQAEKDYEHIQNALICIFAAKRFPDAEDLADEVIDRVAERLPEIAPTYVGAPAHYFRGVARKVVFEVKRRKEIALDSLPERPAKHIDVREEHRCLKSCLKLISSHDRDFLLDYHVYEGGDKVRNHETMAEELDISVNALRVKAHRMRIKLEKCVRECLG